MAISFALETLSTFPVIANGTSSASIIEQKVGLIALEALSALADLAIERTDFANVGEPIRIISNWALLLASIG